MHLETPGQQNQNDQLCGQEQTIKRVQKKPDEVLASEPVKLESSLYLYVYMKNMHRVKKGHFVVGLELITHLYLKLASQGYKINDFGIKGSRIRPDLAVGKKFHDYLVGSKTDIFNKFEYDEFTDEQERPFTVRQYTFELLPKFLEYFENIWLVEHAPNYFQSRDPYCVEFLVDLINKK